MPVQEQQSGLLSAVDPGLPSAPQSVGPQVRSGASQPRQHHRTATTRDIQAITATRVIMDTLGIKATATTNNRD